MHFIPFVVPVQRKRIRLASPWALIGLMVRMRDPVHAAVNFSGSGIPNGLPFGIAPAFPV
jgi:hypothetical protein